MGTVKKKKVVFFIRFIGLLTRAWANTEKFMKKRAKISPLLTSAFFSLLRPLFHL